MSKFLEALGTARAALIGLDSKKNFGRLGDVKVSEYYGGEKGYENQKVSVST